MSSDTNMDRFGCRSSLSEFVRYDASSSPHRRKPRHSDSLKPGKPNHFQKPLAEMTMVPGKRGSDMNTTTVLCAPEIDRSTDFERLLRRRAIEAAIWGMPIVRFDTMRQAFFRDAQAVYGDICYWSKPDWRLQIPTVNTQTGYVYFNFNTRMGPVVIDVPPAADVCLAGAIVSAWESTLVEVGQEGFDKGRGGKYLVLPPDYTGMVPSRYISVRSETYNGRALFCLKPGSGETPPDETSITDFVRRMRVYSLIQAVNPPEQRFIDMSERLFDGAVHFDDTLFDSLARMVIEEPKRTRDLVAMSVMHSLGIGHDGTFAPNVVAREILNQSADEVRAGLMKMTTSGESLSPSTQWTRSDTGCCGPAFTYESANRFGIDERNVEFFMAFATPGKRRRPAPCLRAFGDARGEPLQGGTSYQLRIPAGVPMKHWEIAAYDLETACFIRKSPSVAISSGSPTTKQNADGSVDVYFGAQPVSPECNWIYTEPSRPWFVLFRLYEPEKAAFDTSWVLPDLE